MKKKGNLHALIHALSASERRHFRLYAKASGSSKNYLDLFDALVAQPAYDEAALMLAFRDRPFSKQLHVTKNYLSKLILKSLRNFHSKVSKDAELKDLMREVDLLFRKELFDHCHYALEKAEKIALRFEKFTQLSEIQGWKRKLIIAHSGVFKEKETLKSLVKQEAAYLELALQTNRYWQLTLEMYDRGFGNPESVKYIQEHPLISDPEQANSIQSKVLRYHLLFATQSVSNQQELGGRSLDELISLFEANPERIKEDPSSYITALNNRVGMLIYSRQTESVPALLLKIRAIPETYGLSVKGNIVRRLLLRTYNVELELYRDTRQVQKGLALIKEVEGFINEYAEAIPTEYILSFYYQFAYLHFQANSFKLSLRWLHRITNDSFGQAREDIQSYARILSLVIHFELDNIIVLKYVVDNCRRFLRKKRNLQDFEKTLLRFFARICVAGISDYQSLFVQLNADLFDPENPQMTASNLDYLDLKSWVEQHLPKRKMVDRP